LFVAGQFDEAIPEFQLARADPRNRMACNLFIGRCFFEQKLYGPAVDVLKGLLTAAEGAPEEINKEVNYWLGRAYEGNAATNEATEVYNRIIQWDYNYRDVRKRLEHVRGQGTS
jgi:hypothetical protein